jgi:hypothetical protein
MTPRALLTAIGATALAFAIAIGVVAESTTGVTTDVSRSAVSAVEPVSAPLPGAGGAAETRLAAWNDPCVIAV